jgi:hypothetical protein
VETRAADRKLSNDERASLVTALAGTPESYGVWVHYPWSGRIVHVLAESEYAELRTSRNRNKITGEEQSRLARLRVGVVGLSVGQSTAVTLALEGVGGLFRLADFDTLSLSNMNRLRAGAHEIGINKAVLVAREIFEINPFARVEIFARGIVDETVDAFLSDGGNLDLLFEECDDLKMKVRLRHEARERRIPVLMETSDRGLFDIERFDREPNRTLFHGLAGELDPARLAGMTTYEKIPIVLDIIGANTMSLRMAASLVDIDATLKTWPQLASAVALGGAINTDAARRVALGKFNRSGRFYVDLESIISDGDARDGVVESDAHLYEDPSPRSSSSSSREIKLRHGEPISSSVLEQIVRLAAMAPSGGNCQPWRFTYRGGTLRCWHDEERSRSFLDFEHRGTYLAFGALAENLRLAAGRLGLGISLRPFPVSSEPLLICEAAFGELARPPTSEDEELARQIDLRVTNRRLGARVALVGEEARLLQEIAGRAGAQLRLVTQPERLSILADIVGMGERLRLLSKVMHRQMMSEVRWTAEQAAATRDGLDLSTLELTPTDLAGLRLISRWSVMAAVREVNGGHGLTLATQKAVRAASAVGLLSVSNPTTDVASRRLAYFQGGTALQRVWLTSTRLGLAFQPMTPLVYLFARLVDGQGEGLADDEKSELRGLRARYRDVLDLADAPTEVMLFRLAKTGPPTARSLRRDVAEMLSIE